jgi:hypothetical protein
MEWKLLDQEVVAAKGQGHAALLLGEPLPASFTPAPGSRDIRLPTLTALDWMRRALLAERLFHDDEALLAYKVGCAALAPFPAGPGLSAPHRGVCGRIACRCWRPGCRRRCAAAPLPRPRA